MHMRAQDTSRPTAFTSEQSCSLHCFKSITWTSCRNHRPSVNSCKATMGGAWRGVTEPGVWMAQDRRLQAALWHISLLYKSRHS